MDRSSRAALPDEVDVLVVGGGINGACAFHHLAAAGYRVLLVDRADFGSGTSEASAMMIWGGLLYLKDWELLTVARLSASRDRLIERHPGEIRTRRIRYVPTRGGRSRAFVQSVLYAYWMLGGMRRRRPVFDRIFPERTLLKESPAGALTYEEAGLETSDARFVLGWILAGEACGGVARNYWALASATIDRARKAWRCELTDSHGGRCHEVTASLVVNAAGGWTDDINARAGIVSPYRHVLSRGVSICIPRDPCHQHHLAFDNGVDGNAMALIPWGPVALWGSTDSIHDDMAAARRPEAGDLRFLFAQLNGRVARQVDPAATVSLRCGVRPVAVPRNAAVDSRRGSLSRRHHVHLDPHLPWISVYGGKLSGCTTVAAQVGARVSGRVGPPRHPAAARLAASCPPRNERFPGIDADVVAPGWSASHEHCRTIEDYLRRRTNIAQWTPRGGFGRDLDYEGHIRAIARILHGGDQPRADADVNLYRARVDQEWTLLKEAAL